MAVPAHDTRDNEFALKYNIPIKWVVRNEASSSDEVYPGVGIIENSSSVETGLDINQLSSKEAALKVIEWAERTGNGKKKVSSSCLLSLCKTLALLFLTFKGFFLLAGKLQVEGLAICKAALLGRTYPYLNFG